MGYQRNVISGFSWQTTLKVFSNGLSLLKIVILARLLSPTDFGLFSLIVIALGIMEALTETGINYTILQSKRSVEYFLNTAWVIAIVRGFLIGILMVLLGILMGSFYDQPQLPILVAFAALIPIIKGFINPSIISLQKNLQFFHDALFRFSLVFVEVFFSVIFALILQSVVALILGFITAAVFEVIISFIFFKSRPVFQFLSGRARTIFNNAKGLNVHAIFTYLNENVDDFILGKTVGTYHLGLYHNGYALGHRANYMLAQAAFHGTLPILTKIDEQKSRLRGAFRKYALSVIGITLLTTIPLILFPDWIVQVVLGEGWLEVIPALPILALAGLLHAVTLVGYTLFFSIKKYRLMNAHLLLTIVLLIPLLIILSTTYGIVGGSWAVVLSRALPLPLLGYGVWNELR